MKLKKLFLQTFTYWRRDGVFSEGAALSFYTLVSLPALVLSLLLLTGIFLQKNELQNEIIQQTSLLFGDQGKNLILQIFENVPSIHTLQIVSVMSIFVLLFGALGFFEQLQMSLNKIWGVQMKSNLGIKGFLRNKALLFLMVILFGAILFMTIALEAAFSFIFPYFESILPVSINLLQISGAAIGFILILMIFAMVYKYLPLIKVQWRDVLVGAFITTVLFSLGKYLIGLYLSKSTFASSYGAAGSVVVFLLWVYYSSQIIFLGAEFTKQYTTLYGSKIKPSKEAVSTAPWWKRILG